MMILFTGVGGLMGSEAAWQLYRYGHRVDEVKNNQRIVFFGENGSIRSGWNSLEWAHGNVTNHKVKIRDCITVLELLKTARFNGLGDTAAHPSHDRTAAIPFDKFEANATGTLNLLNGVRNSKPICIFWHMSIYKVYSDRLTNLVERETRYDFAVPELSDAIADHLSGDQSIHSLFGASALAAA